MVASFTGAWIETESPCNGVPLALSHPLRVRGLKHDSPEHIHIMPASHPLRVRGLKRLPIIANTVGNMSHPLRVRGLKPDYGSGNRYRT